MQVWQFSSSRKKAAEGIKTRVQTVRSLDCISSVYLDICCPLGTVTWTRAKSSYRLHLSKYDPTGPALHYLADHPFRHTFLYAPLYEYTTCYTCFPPPHRGLSLQRLEGNKTKESRKARGKPAVKGRQQTNSRLSKKQHKQA